MARLLGDVGEHAWIARIMRRLGATRVDRRVLLGPGDDAAAIRPGRRPLLLTTDTLIEGVHFRAGWAPPAALGRRAFAVNASDLAAMGGAPTFALLALEAPASLRVADLDALVLGFARAARQAGARLVGGNLAAGPHLAITATLLGEAPGPVIGRSRTPAISAALAAPARRSSPRVSPSRRPVAALSGPPLRSSPPPWGRTTSCWWPSRRAPSARSGACAGGSAAGSRGSAGSSLAGRSSDWSTPRAGASRRPARASTTSASALARYLHTTPPRPSVHAGAGDGPAKGASVHCPVSATGESSTSVTRSGRCGRPRMPRFPTTLIAR
ncbi:MAG: hypothetical protein E6J83_17200 [Deltaproteobacteria bacterium]|nr:MAG: hypothetical protein E6J83_17200 [Deltaproteobacteria bacterium]